MPYTKHQLHQQTNAALAFVTIVIPGKVCNLILRFSHAVEQSFATVEIANSEASRLCTQLEEGTSGGKKRKHRKAVGKARVLTVGEGIAVVEEMDSASSTTWSARGNLNTGRPSVMQVSRGSGSLAIYATPRRARVRFEAAVTLLSSKSTSTANLYNVSDPHVGHDNISDKKN